MNTALAQTIALHLMSTNAGASADCIRLAALVQVFVDRHIDTLVADIRGGMDPEALMVEFFAAFRTFAANA